MINWYPIVASVCCTLSLFLGMWIGYRRGHVAGQRRAATVLETSILPEMRKLNESLRRKDPTS